MAKVVSGVFQLSPKKSTNLRRVSFGTPLLNGPPPIIITPVLSDIQNNDDQAEKRARQLNRVQELQAKVKSSPASQSSLNRRKSINAVTGLTNQQLADHYSKCIQLSTENKINVKNAFNLQLIDYMTEMLYRKDAEMNNFQMVSCTLDASTKIYAYRVDSIHTDTLKIAGGLGRTKDNDGGRENGGDDDPNDVGGTKTRKRKKRVATIEANVSNLNLSHFDVEFNVDPFFQKMSSQFDDGASLFLNTLPILDDHCQFVLDSDTVLKTIPNEEMNEHTDVYINRLADLTTVICPTFESFEFKNFSLDDTLDPVRQNLEEAHAFDMNAIPEPIEPENMDMDHDDAPPLHDDYDQQFGETEIVEGCAMNNKTLVTTLDITSVKEHLTTAPLEYSYFDSKLLSAWAGPGHWRLKAVPRDVSKLSEKGKPRKKNEITIDYEEKEQLQRNFDVLRKAIKLTQTTIKNWNIETTTLPTDLHYDPNKFSRLYLKESSVIRLKDIEKNKSVDESIQEYDYENKKNMSMSQLQDDMDNYDDSGAEIPDTSMFPSQTPIDHPTTDFFGDNLVVAPNIVEKINIGYAKTAKKMDMRKLKSTMWNLLTYSNENKENESNNAQQKNIYKEKMETLTKVKFENLYQNVQPKLSTTMAENLSIPLAFVALLHLCNEHSLMLHSVSELGDFEIKQD